MYSVLLMAAVAAGEASPALHHKGHSAGDCNVYVGHSWGSWGSGYGGCYGIGYTGWVNVGGWGHPHASTGGWGHAYSSEAGWGRAYNGTAPWGEGYGSIVPWGMGYGGYDFTNARWPGWTGSGDFFYHFRGLTGPPPVRYVSPSGGASPAGTVPPPAPILPPGTVVPEATQTTRQAGGAGAARLVVNLPAGARLFVDDREIEKPGASRTFRSPALEKGEVYYYELRAEVERDGKVLSQKRRVVVSAGRTVTADFTDLGSATSVAAAKAR